MLLEAAVFAGGARRARTEATLSRDNAVEAAFGTVKANSLVCLGVSLGCALQAGAPESLLVKKLVSLSLKVLVFLDRHELLK